MSAEARYTPDEIAPTEDGRALAIRWKDGVRTVHAPRALRLRCPCAGCVDERTGRRTLVPGDVPPDIHPTAIHYVGRYALQFVWSDGHSTGIYPYEYLRRLAEEEAGPPGPPDAGGGAEGEGSGAEPDGT